MIERFPALGLQGRRPMETWLLETDILIKNIINNKFLLLPPPRRSRCHHHGQVYTVAGFGLTLPDPPLRFLFCVASRLALALPHLLGLALRVSLVCAATSLTLAGTGPPEVNDGRCALHRGLRKGVTKTRWS